MRKLHLFSALVLSVIFGSSAIYAQDFSNKGKEFWFCFPNHIRSGNVNGSMSIWITSDRASSGTIVMTNGTFSANWSVTANGITQIDIPYNLAHIGNAESGTVIQKSLKLSVNSGQPAVVAYAQQYGNARSAATLLLPTSVLGKKYLAASYTYTATANGGQNSRSQFQVIATKPNTSVRITPYSNGVPGASFTINFTNAGDMYQYQATSDVTGSIIESIASANGSCLPIAVFSGSSASTIGTVTCINPGSYDPLFQQLYPVTTWGKNYGFIPFGDYTAGNPYRVMASEDNTSVFINGTLVATLNTGQVYPSTYNLTPVTLTQPTSIISDKPICVIQYAQTRDCSGTNNGDPDMVILNPIEQNIKDITIFASTQQNINRQWINILIPTAGVSSFRIDGAVPSTAFQPAPNIPGYSYLTHRFLPAISGSHRITSDSGFNAICYGFEQSAYESYAYSAGTNVKDIYQFISLQNQYATVNFPATCRSTPFFFSMTFPYQPTQIQWIFGAALNAMGIADVTLNAPVPTSTIVVAGKTLYVYQLPTPYIITAAGTYPIKVVANNPTPDGCSGIQEIDFDVQVFDPPVADFTFNNVCFPDPVQFNDNSNTGGRPITSRYWNFGDANTSVASSPSHAYAAPGAYTVKYAIITDVGCLSDTASHVVTVSPLPTATISGTTTVCLNGTSPNITFTGAVGTPPYTFIYNINGGPNQTVTTTSGNSVTVAAPTTTAGTYTYNLVSVSDASPAVCSQAQTGSATVTVSPLPTATISGAATVCLNAPSPNITFTGAVGTPPYTFTYNINGGPNQAVTTTSGNTVTVAVPTSTAGTYTYNLVSVQEGSTNLCSQAQTGSTVVTVSPLPTATISGTTTVCLNGTPPVITFTGANGAAPYTFTYNINGGPNQTVTTTSGNSVTVAAPTATAGTYTYNLVSVAESSSNICTQLQTGSAIITVNPLPTASISGATTVCLNAPSPSVTFTGAAGTAPYTFTYNINGGPNQNVTTTSGNSVTVAAPTTVAGTFTYNLVSVQEGSSIQCSQSQTGSVVITVNQLPTASISGTTNVCVNAPSPNITFTGASGTAPYTFTYTINGGPNLVVTTTSGNSVNVAVPTTAAGTFVYSLVSVQEGSGIQCSQLQTGSATVIVNPLPTASISGNTEVCLNAPSPDITFTGATGTAPYTFTYNINGGPNQTVSTTTGNSVTVSVPTSVAGTFTFNLVSVLDGSSTLCSQAQTGSATVIVNPLPTSNFTVVTPSCETRVTSFTDASVPNAGNIISWQWNFGDPASGPFNTSTLQNPTHIFSTAGTYTVSLVVTTDKGCVSITPPQQVVINARPLAGFILPEVCLSDTYAQFTDTSSVDAPDFIQAWQWNFGDPGSGPLNTSTLQNPQHSYTATGSYNVQLIATSNNGCRDTVTQVLFINGSFPVADFTIQNPTTLCANDSVAIVEASTVFPGTITKVEIYWDNVNQPAVFDTDNSPFTGKVYKHLYPNFQAPLTRTFTIRYRAYSGGVCVNDKLQNITVNAAPLVQFNAVPNVCFDAAAFSLSPYVSFGAVPGTGTYTGPGVTTGGIFTPSSVAPGGTYTIQYLHTSTAAGCRDSATQTITVIDTASARFVVSNLACERSPVSFNSTSSTIPPTAGTITGWQWNFGDPASGAANTSTLQNPTHLFTGWGTYSVSLVVTTSNGCRSTAFNMPVVVNPIPRPNFSFPASSCLPSANVQFTNLSTIPDGSQASFSYLWNFGDPASGPLNTSTGSAPSHIYNAVGPYSVNLLVTSGAGCARDTTIVLNTIHPQPTGSFNVDKPDLCVGESFQFTDNSNPADGTTTQWNWTMGDGNIRTTPSFTYTYGSAGTYNVSLFITNNFGCRSTTFTQQVTVNPYPVVDAGPDLFILEDGSDTLQPIVTAINPSFLWTPNQYFLSSNTIEQPIVKGVEDIWYTLTVTGRGGCVSSDRVFIKVLKGPEIPNIFSPNGDGIHDRWEIKYLDTYPGGTVEIFNRYGQKIFSSVGYGKPWDGTVNGKPVPVGTYYYIVNPKNGRSIMTGYVDVIR